MVYLGMNKWGILHEYRRAAKDNLVDPLLCPLCKDGSPLIPFIAEEDEPGLRCWSCESNFPLDDSIFVRMLDTLEDVW